MPDNLEFELPEKFIKDVPLVEPFQDTFTETLQRMLPQLLEIITKARYREPSTLVLQGLTEFIGDTILCMRDSPSEDAERLKVQIVALRKMRTDFEDLIYV